MTHVNYLRPLPAEFHKTVFTVITYTQVCIQLYGEDWWRTSASRTWESECRDLREYCSRMNFHYYGEPNDEFSEAEAVAQAQAGNYDGVVLDNLS